MVKMINKHIFCKKMLLKYKRLMSVIIFKHSHGQITTDMT